MSKAISECKQPKRLLQISLFFSVLGILGVFSFASVLSIAQAAATTGRIEITALADGKNVSSQCFGVATSQETAGVCFLQPSNGVIAAEAPPGTYNVVVTFDAGENTTGTGNTTMFSIMRITVVAGKVSRETATLASALYPGVFGGGAPGTGGPGGGQGDGPGDRPWGDDRGSDNNGFGDDDYYDSGDHDDHGDRPRDERGKGQGPEDDGFYDDLPDVVLIPFGDVTLRWTARYTATVTEDKHYKFADTYAFYPGGTDTSSLDQLELVFSGTYTWRVTGISDSIVDLEEVSGELSWSGSGSGEISEIERRTVQCYKDKARLLGPYDRQIEYTADSSWNYIVQKPRGISPPVPIIYQSGWYRIGFPQVHDLGISISGKRVSKTEDCDGVDTETSPIDSPGSFASSFCELTISDAFNSEEFRKQLSGECDIDTPWKAFTVSGHGTWNLDKSDTQTDPYGLGQSQYESHGVVDISYTLSFVPEEPVIPIVPLVPPEESQPDPGKPEASGSDSDEPEWPVVPLVPPEGSGSDSADNDIPVVPLVPPEGSAGDSSEPVIPVVPLVPPDGS